MNVDVALSGTTSTAERRLPDPVRLNAPLSLRGLIVALFLFYLLIGPVPDHSDVVAAFVATTLLTILCLIAATTILVGARLNGALSAAVYPPGDRSTPQARSRALEAFVIALAPLRILPFYSLTVKIQFAVRGIDTVQHRLTGFFPGRVRLRELLTFPHRGDWKLRCVSCSFGDLLGFSNYRWEMRELDQSSVPVHPPVVADAGLPVLSSSMRPGEEVIHAKERHGEMFDLKPYHPSDGLRKIVWKVYAKSGQLISRHPEAAMTPEGQVLVYTVGDRHDDSAIAWSLAYLRQLEALDLLVFFGVEGMPRGALCESSERAEQLTVDTAWSAGSAISRDIRSDLEQLIMAAQGPLQETKIFSIVIFVSNHRLGRAGNASALLGAAEELTQRGISPVFCIVEEEPPVVRRGGPSLQRLIVRTPRIERAQYSPEDYRNFLGACNRQGWETFIRKVETLL